jgi:SAM-dependent methyltransferase
MNSVIQNPELTFICPSCQHELSFIHDHYTCTAISCQAEYPIVNNIPILIDDAKSIFKKTDFLNAAETTFNTKRQNYKNLAKKILPSISKNINVKKNVGKYADLLIERNAKPRVLIVGGGILGAGMEVLEEKGIELIETDVSFGPRTKLIADAHAIPFKSESFDGVVVQAVLEHVLDPQQCVAEIYRVLRKDGFVYAETPFMQQVHMPPYDFTRFTYLGHIRLFRHFRMLESGFALGPGSALAWSTMYFYLSFSNNKWIRMAFAAIVHLTAFWLKYFDYLLLRKNTALDAASGYFFIFQKSDTILKDSDLMNYFKGGVEF